MEANRAVNARSYRIEFDRLGETIEKLIVEVVPFSIEQVLDSGLIANDLRPQTSSYGKSNSARLSSIYESLYLAHECVERRQPR